LEQSSTKGALGEFLVSNSTTMSEGKGAKTGGGCLAQWTREYMVFNVLASQ